MDFIGHDGRQIRDGQWDGYTLILPCVSVANVPQLAVDLLVNQHIEDSAQPIAEHDVKLIGCLWSENVYPFAGVDPYFMDGKNHATSIQVFVSESKKIVIIQQRSPVYKECREEFYNELSAWIGRHQLETIIVLSSSFDQFLMPELHDSAQVPIKYLGYNMNDSLRDYIKKNSRIQPVVPVDPETMIPNAEGRIYLPGSGSTRGFIKMFAKVLPKTPLVCLILFCSEGENQLHAMVFADVVSELINRDKIVLPVREHKEGYSFSKYSWQTPWSWRRMFGNEPPVHMF